MSVKFYTKECHSFAPNPAQIFVKSLVNWRRKAVKLGHKKYGIPTVEALGRLSKKTQGVKYSSLGWARLILNHEQDIHLIMPGESASTFSGFTRKWNEARDWASQMVAHQLKYGYCSGES